MELPEHVLFKRECSPFLLSRLLPSLPSASCFLPFRSLRSISSLAWSSWGTPNSLHAPGLLAPVVLIFSSFMVNFLTLYFSSLFLLRTALHYLNAWNRLVLNCRLFRYCTWSSISAVSDHVIAGIAWNISDLLYPVGRDNKTFFSSKNNNNS